MQLECSLKCSASPHLLLHLLLPGGKWPSCRPRRACLQPSYARWVFRPVHQLLCQLPLAATKLTAMLLLCHHSAASDTLSSIELCKLWTVRCLRTRAGLQADKRVARSNYAIRCPALPEIVAAIGVCSSVTRRQNTHASNVSVEGRTAETTAIGCHCASKLCSCRGQLDATVLVSCTECRRPWPTAKSHMNDSRRSADTLDTAQRPQELGVPEPTQHDLTVRTRI